MADGLRIAARGLHHGLVLDRRPAWLGSARRVVAPSRGDLRPCDRAVGGPRLGDRGNHVKLRLGQY